MRKNYVLNETLNSDLLQDDLPDKGRLQQTVSNEIVRTISRSLLKMNREAYEKLGR